MPNAIELLSGAVLAAALVFGGASAQGVTVDAVPQLLSLPLLVLVAAESHLVVRNGGSPLLLMASAVSLLLLQLVPLPPSIWSQLPGRSALIDMYGVSGVSAPWLPISMSPGATARTALSMLPALSVFLGTLCLDWAARRRLAALALSLGLASVLLVIIQRMGGSPATGLFANQNHNAAFLYSLIPFSVALLGNNVALLENKDFLTIQSPRFSLAKPPRWNVAADRGGRTRTHHNPAHEAPPLGGERRKGAHRHLKKSRWGSLARIFFLLISVLMLWLGLVMAGSRLGLVLGFAASLGALWIFSRGALDPAKRTRALLWAVLFLVLILPLLVPFGLVDIAARFQG